MAKLECVTVISPTSLTQIRRKNLQVWVCWTRPTQRRSLFIVRLGRQQKWPLFWPDSFNVESPSINRRLDLWTTNKVASKNCFESLSLSASVFLTHDTKWFLYQVTRVKRFVFIRVIRYPVKGLNTRSYFD